MAIWLPSAGAAEVDQARHDPGAWGSYQGLKVPGGLENRVLRGFQASSSTLSSFNLEAGDVTSEGGSVTFSYSPLVKDQKALNQSSVGIKSRFSFYGQLGDPRYGVRGADGLMPSDRPGGFVYDAQRDFRHNSGFSLGIGYDF